MDGQIYAQHMTAAQPRAVGRAMVAAKSRDGRSHIADLRQSGSAKILFPRTHTPDLHAVLLNTAGGITGGDRFEYAAEAKAGAALTLSTQACERGYRAQPDAT
ncbi:MAG: urease accessory protein UreD, partial [Pseudomonadota bacterium]